MQIRHLLAALLLLLTLAGCNAARPTPTPPATPELATTATPAPAPTPIPIATPTPAPTPAPSSTAPSPTAPLPKPAGSPTPPKEISHIPRDVGSFSLFSLWHRGAAHADYSVSSVEAVLQKGLRESELSPTHIAIRGSTSASSVRCLWRGVARTLEQREAAVRFWLDLEDTLPLPTAMELETRFIDILTEINPAFPETAKSGFVGIARGGLITDTLFLSCFLDYEVSDYLLGAGPSSLTVSYDRAGEGRSYGLYKLAHQAGEFYGELLMSESAYRDLQNETLSSAEEFLAHALGGRESIVFLAPMAAHNAIAVQAWQAVAQWDVQLVDGVLQAVRYGAGDHDPEYRQPLAGLKSRITTAAASDQFAGKRIASTEGLEAYYREIGAYDDITPGDGLDNPFTPAQPPPPHPTPDP